ncbi:MAG: LLM class flavin-dependent oxidoreductase [Nitrososphaerales archaeon]
MKIGVSFGHGLAPSEVLAGAKVAEESGFASVWVSESTGFDSLSILGAIASQTRKMELGSGIVNIYSRSATQLAMASASIDELSRGRFTLGVGASSESVISEWHRLEYAAQLSRMKDAVQEIKEKLRGPRGSSLHFRNETFVPIVIAAVHNKMVLLAKEIADGVLFFLRPLSRLREDTRSIAKENFSVHASVVCCVSSDTRIAEERVRRTVAFYLAHGEHYRRFIQAHTSLLEGTSSTIRDLWLKGKREEAARLVPREILDEVAIFGTPSECNRKIEQDYYTIDSLSTLALQFNPGENSTLESFKNLRLIAQEFDTSGKRK